MKKQNHAGNGASHDHDQPQEEWDLESLRVKPSEANELGIEKIITHVQVGRPNNQEFFRVRPGEEWRLTAAVLELKEDREHFLVVPALLDQIPGTAKLKELVCVMTRQGTLKLWPLTIPSDERRSNSWTTSALSAAKHAEAKWVRMSSNMAAGAYDVHVAAGKLPDPDWPVLTMPEIVKLAFRDNLIDRLDHDVLKRLRGDL